MNRYALSVAFYLVVSCPLLSAVLQAQWIQTTGPSHDGITSFCVRGTTVFAATATGSVYNTSDVGDHWKQADSGLVGAYVYNLLEQGENLFAATDSGVFKSTNGGGIWAKIGRGLPQRRILEVVGDSTALFAASDTGIFISRNEGDAWEAVDSGLTTLKVGSLAALHGTIIAGTSLKGLFLSHDSGSSWIPIDSIPINYSYLNVHRLSPVGDVLYAAADWMPQFVAFYGGLLVSTDRGSSWTIGSAIGGVEGGDMYVFDLASSGPNLFEAASWSWFMNPSVNGVFLSRDSAKSWVPVMAGLKDSSVLSLAVSGGYLLAGTQSSGVWRRPLSEMTTSVPQTPAAIPLAFELNQNYPNPFNPSTTIRYGLPTRSHVTLAVFNTLGQQVATLVDAVHEPGEHSVRFDGGGLASGVYFYRLTAGEYVATKRLVLIR